ncbi:MAG: WYL domain-containing protein [Syntrophomonadaceae bacterium]|nr:WYL domain-containing protein [Syntrophomonadaceae bacterium]
MPRVKKDAAQMLRLNIIVDQLNRKTPYGGITIKELAERTEVSERQIYRDLQAIENDLRVPLVRREGNGKTIRVSLKYGYLPSLSPEKATVIFLSMLQQKGSALSGHLNEIKNSLISTLFKYHYNPRQLAVEKLQERIHLVEETLTEPHRTGEVFIKLVQAVRDSYQVKLWYYVGYSGEETERVVEPYGLICKRQNWYLIGRCLMRDAIRVFRVDQIRDVIAYNNNSFEYPEDFSVTEYMDPCWGVINDQDCHYIRLRFSGRFAYRIRNMLYHHSQRVEEELPDGSLIVSFYVCGVAEMTGWLIQWGDSVEVLEPDWLRQEMANKAKRIWEMYEGYKN